MDSSEAAVSIYREEPDSVLALRGRLHLNLARKLHRTALDLALTGGRVVVDVKLALEHVAGSDAPGAPPRKRRGSPRKPVI
jgi:hypothetical protein